MADAAVGFLLENLKQLLTDNSRLITGAKNELRLLQQDVGHLKTFSEDLAMVPNKDGELGDIDREIRKVVYEMEDTIDVCLSQMAAPKSKSYFIRHLGTSNRLRRVVKSLREEVVKPILDRVKDHSYIIRLVDAASTSEEETKTILKKENLIRQDKVVGFEDEEETIIGYLMEEKEELDVICVTGMSGLGKTTLAWKIYQNERIAFEFPIRLWIHVSQKFNKRDMLLYILKRFTSQDPSRMSEDELSQNVRVCLNDEKFLLVLDDVCRDEDWEAIQNILPKSNGKGKVLITSSVNSVGARANVYRKPHEKRFLTDEESWKLLQSEVFGSLTDYPRELEKIGKIIAIKCGGLPLQVVALSGVLTDQLMKSQAPGAITREWEKVSENVDLFLHNVKSLSDVVELTYSRLPDELRDCFLYMGVFPEDYEISTWTLTRLWIAEAFITPRDGMSLEEIATQYLYDLISRNLAMATKINAHGEVKACRVHKMIRVFCVGKAQDRNLFRVIKISQNGAVEPQDSELQSCRRLCLDSNAISQVLPGLPKSQAVRSFLCFHEISRDVDPRYTSAVSDAFELLKVWESKTLRFDRFHPRITRLLHLRYITLSVNHLQSLPESLSDLWNLQTLVVDTTSRSITMKANIWRLMRLRHLKTNAAIVLNLKEKGKGGESLQTLNRLSPESCTEDLCGRAPNLKTLGIQGNLATLLGNESLSKLERLEKLKLLNVLLYESASDNPLSKLPLRDRFPPRLKSLTISNTFLHWEHMSTLGMINSLEVLKLKSNAFSGIYWTAAGDIFPNLRFLLISDADLVQWEASDSSFPQLSCLVLKNCRNLNVIPLELANTLERLDIDRVRKSAVDSARRIAEAKKQAQVAEKAKWRPPFNLSIGPGFLT